ncbi:hypothetical protein DL95DRAFT_307608, partial [Leptodontidium sp. 2 PMI_412]
EARERLQEVVGVHERIFGKEPPHTLTAMDNLASIYKNNQQWEKSEELSLEVIHTRKRVQGIGHPDTLSSIANLKSTYGDQGRVKGTVGLTWFDTTHLAHT